MPKHHPPASDSASPGRHDWATVKDILANALELPANARDAYLDHACGTSTALRAEVDELLAANSPEFLEVPAPEIHRTMLRSPGLDADARRRVGPFTIVREIGRGGMGTVYLAERSDGEFERQVAIKVSPWGVDSALGGRRFRKERQILAALDHPNVARLIDSGTTSDGLLYFVMEYVDGVSLDRYCRDKLLSIAARLALFDDVCAAVEYAHQRLVVHRDIKPGNVLVAADGRVKLLDFGIATLLTPHDSTGITSPRALTPDYASPEQLRGDAVTTLSDVYSLGVMLYELLAGTHPYASERRDLQSLVRALDGPPPSKPSSVIARDNALARSLRGDLDTIVMRAMDRDANRRYQSVQALRADLQRYLRAEPVTAQPDTLWYRTTKFVQRHRWPVVFASAAALALIGGAAGFAWQARVANAQRAAATRQSSSVRKLALTLLFDVHDSIATLPGATRAREQIVSRALASLDTLAKENQGDGRQADLQRDLATAFVKVGDVQGEPYRPNLGHTEAALASYQRATSLLEPLVRANAHDTVAIRALAIAQLKIGAIHLRARNWNAAESAERSAVRWLESIRTSASGDSLTQMSLGNALKYFGDALAASDDMWSRDRVTAAREAYARSLSVFESLAGGRDRDPSLERAISSAYTRLGYASSSLGLLTGDTAHYTQSLEYHRRGHERLVRALSRDPADGGLRRAVADCAMDMANVEVQRGNAAPALALLDSAGPMFESLARADAANVEARRDLAYFRENRAAVLLTLHRAVDGARDAREASATLRELQSYDAGSVEDFYHLAHAQKLLGDAYAQSRQADNARAAYAAAEATVAQWERAEPKAARAAKLSAEIREHGLSSPR